MRSLLLFLLCGALCLLPSRLCAEMSEQEPNVSKEDPILEQSTADLTLEKNVFQEMTESETTSKLGQESFTVAQPLLLARWMVGVERLSPPAVRALAPLDLAGPTMCLCRRLLLSGRQLTGESDHPQSFVRLEAELLPQACPT